MAQYEAQRAERQYLAVGPENRIMACTLEQRWNEQLQALERVEREAEQALQAPALLSDEELEKVRLLGAVLGALWEAPTTTNRDRKRLLRCLIEEVKLRTEVGHHAVRIVWTGGAVNERELERGKPGWVRRREKGSSLIPHRTKSTRGACRTAAHRPGARAAAVGRGARGCGAGLGHPGATGARVRLEPAGAVVALPVARLSRRRARGAFHICRSNITGRLRTKCHIFQQVPATGFVEGT